MYYMPRCISENVAIGLIELSFREVGKLTLNNNYNGKLQWNGSHNSESISVINKFYDVLRSAKNYTNFLSGSRKQEEIQFFCKLWTKRNFPNLV